MAPVKAGIQGFVPNLTVPGQLSPLAMLPYPAVDPTAASRLAAALDVPQPSFGALPAPFASYHHVGLHSRSFCSTHA